MPAHAQDQGQDGDFYWQQLGSSIDIYYYGGYGGTIVIPTNIDNLPVTSIVDTNSPQISAFYNCPNPFQVVLPNTFTSVEAGAFQNCQTLIGVTLPDSITNIGIGAFSNSSLPSITLPEELVNIGDHAFDSCYSISDLTIPDSVTTIGNYAFYSDLSLMNLAFGANVSTIGDYAFSGCYLSSLSLPLTVTSIGAHAFDGCAQFGSVSIPASVTNISSAAFANCSSLTNACFQGNAPADGGQIFSNTAITVIYYIAGTAGWGTNFDGISTEPCVECGDASGSLQVNITPDAVATNAISPGLWELDYSGIWLTNGTVLTNLVGGTHTVSYTNVPGWVAPANQNIVITNGLLTVVTGNYTVVQLGSLQVILNPAGAATNGAEWQVDGGPWLNSGNTASNLSPGSHTVSFSTIPNWFTPFTQLATVVSGQTNIIGATYQPAGYLQVFLSPNNVVIAGETWSVDGGAWQTNGNVLELSPGSHVISFLPIAWWTTPANITTTVTAGSTNQLNVSSSLGGIDGYATVLAQYDSQPLYQFTTLAGTPGNAGDVDASGAAAAFDFPVSVKLGAGNTLFVADFYNSTIRQLTLSGTNWVVTTIAGQPGVTGHADGTNNNALFDNPFELTVDASGNVYVTDYYDYTIRELSPAGTNWVVTTIAGMPGASGDSDGTNNGAAFSALAGITASGGNLFVCDGNAVREVSPVGTNWVVTTIAGQVTVAGSADGTNAAALFHQPEALTPDQNGGLLVVDYGNSTIRRLTPIGTNWVVSTIAGTAGMTGAADGVNGSATFDNPYGIGLDGAGNIYVTDSGNATIRRLTLVGTNYVESTIGGLAGNIGSTDGLGALARFDGPYGMAVANNGNLYLADSLNNTIRMGTPWSVPALNSVTSSNGVVVLNCQSTPGCRYQAQYATNLPTSSWLNLGGPVAATTNTLAIPDSGNTDSSRFYRLILLP